MLVTVTMQVDWDSMQECTVEQVQKYVAEIIKDGCELNFAHAEHVQIDIGGIIR
jgi:hypothetical protein